MNPDSTYAVNEPDVIAESVEGETLIINLNSGVYYSTAGVGDEIWRSLQDGRSVGQVVEAMCGRYSGDADAVRAEVLGFISHLRSEDLIVESEAPATTADAPAPRNGDAPAFAQPVLQRYTDYQELLLLDPIHEVHEPSGWPVVKPETNS